MSWATYSMSARRAPSGPSRRQTRQAATAIKTYNVVQTGPKTALGGLNAGLFSPAYQVVTLEAVANPPTAPTPNVTAIEATSATAPRGFLGAMDRVVMASAPYLTGRFGADSKPQDALSMRRPITALASRVSMAR